LSSRQKKTKGERKEPAKSPKVKPVRPAGKAPEAMVTSRHRTGVVTRMGKGFSMGELAGAGLAPNRAADWGVRLDSRRRSVLDSNVASLKSWGTRPSTTKRVESRAKEVEAEIEKIGREAKKEAVKVEKEAEKVGREVEEEAVKAEKVIRRKAKPKKKAKS
jgi:ribosomal protein L13E